MSNIPPDPPDPPCLGAVAISASAVNLESNQSTHNDVSARARGRGRAGRGRGRNRADGPVIVARGSASNLSIQGERPFAEGLMVDPEQSKNLNSGATPGRRETSRSSNGGRSRQKNPNNNTNEMSSSGVANDSTTRGRVRRGQFGSRLTERGGRSSPTRQRRRSPPPNSDLTTRLIYALRTPPYPDCPICFNPLHPAQPTWSCSVSAEVNSCCWSTFHLKCIREWSRKTLKDVKDALVARGDLHGIEYWRCPGCQAKRNTVPRDYLCFCGAVSDPKAGIATPHSCGLPCSRQRTSCDHPCPLSCHPGPCPPCILTVHPTCHCGKITLAIRCAHSNTMSDDALSCRQLCGRPLQCGTHSCEKVCHTGECEPCCRKEVVRCFCGKNSTEVQCGEGLAQKQEVFITDSTGQITAWSGRYYCQSKCKRTFACGQHECSKGCHIPSPKPDQCPSDPSRSLTCPCGKCVISELTSIPRLKCTDPIPTCYSTCGKPIEGCTHGCSSVCHLGACPPCSIPVTVPCRCGSTTRFVLCNQRQRDIAEGNEIVLCDKTCGALRLCGRHQCPRTCCPLAGISKAKTTKGRKGKAGLQQALKDMDLEASETLWHECDLICGKTLSCGLHQCAEPDHRGQCPPCLQSSFEELVCHCGQTVIHPPVPCGMQISCSYPCDRPAPACGHAKTPHSCHEDSTHCPPCPFLTNKRCACGKTNMTNIRCSQEKVSCGQPCGKLLDCGFHRCQKSCHGDRCGACTSVCGKPRKLCLPSHHPCSLSCHAPSACNESEPCNAIVTVTCSCGHFQQPSKCGKSASNPERILPQLACRDECGIAKRNARLAEALGISSDRMEKSNVVYSEDLTAFGRANIKFLNLAEKTLHDFVTSDKKTQVLPYMPENRRKFVRELCQLYRLDTQLIDPEPRRSIQIYRRIDSRVPTPLLSAHLASQGSALTLGKLADLRAPPTPAPRPASIVKSSIGIMPATRGWTSVVSTASVPSKPNTETTLNSGSPMVAVTTNSRPASHIASTSTKSVRENWESD